VCRRVPGQSGQVRAVADQLERCWNVKQVFGTSASWRFQAVQYCCVRNERGELHWQKECNIGPECMHETQAAVHGRATGLPRGSSVRAGKRVWRIDDYVDGALQCAARLGAVRVRLLARSNARTWTLAIGVRYPGDPCWTVHALLGRSKDSPRRPAIAMELGIEYVNRLPRAVGGQAWTDDDLSLLATQKKLAKLRALRAREEREKRRVVAAMRRRLKRKAAAANAAAAGDHDKAVRLRSGKSKTTRKRAGKKAAETRKRKAREHARRSRAAKKAAATRKANAEHRERTRAKRSAAARAAWARRKEHS
jgi:hypothetical protein